MNVNTSVSEQTFVCDFNNTHNAKIILTYMGNTYVFHLSSFLGMHKWINKIKYIKINRTNITYYTKLNKNIFLKSTQIIGFVIHVSIHSWSIPGQAAPKNAKNRHQLRFRSCFVRNMCQALVCLVHNMSILGSAGNPLETPKF